MENNSKKSLKQIKDEDTLRDYFAAKAMNGICSSFNGQEQIIYYGQIALDSYKIADAMLEERKKQK